MKHTMHITTKTGNIVLHDDDLGNIHDRAYNYLDAEGYSGVSLSRPTNILHVQYEASFIILTNK